MPCRAQRPLLGWQWDDLADAVNGACRELIERAADEDPLGVDDADGGCHQPDNAIGKQRTRLRSRCANPAHELPYAVGQHSRIGGSL